MSSAPTVAMPYRRTNTSRASRIGRAIWSVAWSCLFRPTPRPLHGWRAMLLRLFGARLGRGCHIYAGARIWAPWNLVCGNDVAIADGAEIYNPALVTLGDHAIISQHAYLCAASHDCNDPAFPMIVAPISIGAYAWIASRATVQMDVTVGEGTVLALGGIATGNLDPWTIYGGIPARRLKSRPRLYGTDVHPDEQTP